MRLLVVLERNEGKLYLHWVVNKVAECRGLSMMSSEQAIGGILCKYIFGLRSFEETIYSEFIESN